MGRAIVVIQDPAPSAFAPPDPENFFTAQRRHRRVARWLALLSAVAAAGQSVLAAAMFAPLTLAVMTVVLDLVDRWWFPTLDTYDLLRDRPHQMFGILVLAGLVFVLVIWALLWRSLRGGIAGAALAEGARAPDPRNATEHRLANVVEEMSIAAGIAPPQLLMVGTGMNIAAFGTSPDEATLIVPVELLLALDRRQTEAMVAHQIASISNGDLTILNAVQALPVAWAVPARAMSRPLRRSTWRMWWGLFRLFIGLLPARREAQLLEDLLTQDEKDVDDDNAKQSMGLFKISAGMVWISFSIMRMIAQFLVVGPFVTVWVRRRRYLADATAVQLTRDPAALAGGLVLLARDGGVLPGAGAVDMACVVRPSTGQELRRRTEASQRPEPAGTESFLEGHARYRARLREQDASADPERISRGNLGDNWHPPTAKRLRRLEAMGWLPTEHERAENAAILKRAEPSNSPPVPASRTARWVLGVLFVPLLALILVLFAILIVLLLFLCFFPILMFWALPVYYAVLPLHHWLRS